MSTQRGNTKKGPQKYKNKRAFKNDLHDRTPQMEQIKKIQVTGACQRCKDVIEWKIQYRKYKPLTTAKKCTKCLEKTVKQAYFIICVPCMAKLKVCGKCGQKKEVVEKPGLSTAEEMSQSSQLETELDSLTERQRRQFVRFQVGGKPTGEGPSHQAEDDSDDSASCSGSDSDDDDVDANKDIENVTKTEEILSQEDSVDDLKELT